MRAGNLSNQLRWVILLLAAAVILPTVCLLWFVGQAVKNERWIAQKKLGEVYRSEVNRTFKPFLKWIQTEKQTTERILAQHDFIVAYDKIAASPTPFPCNGFVIFTEPGHLGGYPSLTDQTNVSIDTEELKQAHRLEFSEKQPQAALQEYQHISESTDNRELSQYCQLAQARIHERLGQLDRAIKACEACRKTPVSSFRLYTTSLLKHLDLLQQQGLSDSNVIDDFTKTLESLFAVIRGGAFLGPEFRVFAFQKAVTLYEEHADNLTEDIAPDLAQLQRIITLKSQTLDFLNRYPNINFGKETTQVLEKIVSSNLYALNLYAGDQKIVKLIDAESIIRSLSENLNTPDDVLFQILSPDGRVIAGTPTTDHSPFLMASISSLDHSVILDGWSVEFYETGNTNIFEEATKRQTSIYIWTGVLVALLVLIGGGVSIRAVNRQIQMNRLKNDFIATVTHELKTPLSSMRLLVDTLLEGRYEDKQTVPEYLGLIANENKRLSHLIDSFLTFSRMERNKQVFDFKAVAPKEIAAAGVEAAQAKLNHDGCDFTMEVQDALPNVRGDKDAMVTVLVNLLENACKYSGDDKHIRLKVYSHNGAICFAVTDRGIGISKRAQKKIFQRFYQADSRLSRTAEGCGLGLSIVQFIVEAHKGTIDVESQPGQGSTFTVQLPAV